MGSVDEKSHQFRNAKILRGLLMIVSLLVLCISDCIVRHNTPSDFMDVSSKSIDRLLRGMCCEAYHRLELYAYKRVGERAKAA